MMRLLVPCLLVSALLAGCGEPPAGCEGDGCDLPSVTETTGLIRGVTVDQAIVPLANVTIEAMRGSETVREIRSDKDGTFLLADIEGGAYTLRASKPGYETLEIQNIVENGVAAPPVVRIMLEPIPGYAPFANQFVWSGFVQCNTSYANACLIINYYPDFVLGTGPVTDDESYHTFYSEFVDAARHPDHTQLETVWDSTQALGDAMSIRYQADRPDTLLIDCPYGTGGTVESESPQTFIINATKARQMGIGGADPEDDPDDNCDASEANGVGMEFFAGDSVGLCQPVPLAGCHPRIGLVLEQRTDTFVHAFYDYLPPVDWTFVEAGDYPRPPQ